MAVVVKVKRMVPEAIMPFYAYAGDAAFDVFSIEEKTLAPGERHPFRTGLQFEIPEGYVGLVWDKSSMGVTNGLKILGGVIDCGYRGELVAGLVNLSSAPYTVSKGQKVAQMIIQRKETAELQEVPELSISERGERGFGSSGK